MSFLGCRKRPKNVNFMLKGRAFLRVFLALLLLSGIEAVGNNNFIKVLICESVPPVLLLVLVNAKDPFHIKPM